VVLYYNLKIYACYSFIDFVYAIQIVFVLTIVIIIKLLLLSELDRIYSTSNIISAE